MAALAIASEVALTSSIRVQQQLNIVGDADRLYRLVANLIVNAIQYTPAGGKVTVILDCSHQEAIVQVQDTGIGLGGCRFRAIFDRFYQVNSDRSRNTGGWDSDLAIAQTIARAHRGSLSASSELGRSDIFLLRLPL